LSDIKKRLYIIADELRSMASMKSMFADNPYDAERAHRILQLSTEMTSLIENNDISQEILADFEETKWRHISPAVGVDAFVLNEQGQIFLIQRRDNSRWALPGGICEVGRTPAETAVIELWEEGGLQGRTQRLLSVCDNHLWGGRAKIHLINMMFLMHVDDHTPKFGVECLDAGYFHREQLANLVLHYGYEKRIPASWDAYTSGTVITDLADASSMDLPMHQRGD
jgi:ADP-ribose pyrophosphatase YjhB (NUDIX family)